MMIGTHKLKHDPTLAFDIIERIKNPAIFYSLYKHYPQETDFLLVKLDKFDKTANANDISSLLNLLRNHDEACQHHKNLPEKEKEAVQQIFNTIVTELQELEENLTTHKININCAIDAYTLNRTTHLINLLRSFIEEHSQTVKKNFWDSETRRSQTTNVSNFYQNTKTSPKQTEKVLNVAKDLQSLCEEIRKQIGSAETKPKGLVINFMVYLFEAISLCPPIEINKKLVDSINHEIMQIRQIYPELAEAGEELQKAIANYQPEKP